MPVFHAISIGESPYEFTAPGIAPPEAGCALVAASGSGSEFQLGWTARPVLQEPAVAPTDNTQYLSPGGWANIPQVTSGAIASALGYVPANRDAGDTFGGPVNINGELRIGQFAFSAALAIGNSFDSSGLSLVRQDWRTPMAFEAGIISSRSAFYLFDGSYRGSLTPAAGFTLANDQSFGFSSTNGSNGTRDTQWQRVSPNVSRFVGADGTTLGTIQAADVQYASQVRDSLGIGIRSQAGFLTFYGFNTLGSNEPAASINNDGLRVVGKTIIGAAGYTEAFGSSQLHVNGAAAFSSGTVTSSNPAITVAQTWNGPNSFTAALVSVNRTGTAGAAFTQLLLDLQCDGASRFTVDRVGTVFTSLVRSSLITNGNVWCDSGFRSGSAGTVRWQNSASAEGGTTDLALGRNAAGVLEINNGTAGQYRDVLARNGYFGHTTGNTDAIACIIDSQQAFLKFRNYGIDGVVLSGYLNDPRVLFGEANAQGSIGKGGSDGHNLSRLIFTTGKATFLANSGYSLASDQVQIAGDVVQSFQSSTAWSARSRMLATGQRAFEVGDGASTWQTGYREEFNAGGIRFGWGVTPVARQTFTTGSGADALAQLLHNLGLITKV